MVSMSLNSKQITNFDIDNKSIVQNRTFSIQEGDKTKTITKSYVTILDNVKILKMGYCCEPRGILYPIYIYINGAYREIRIGKNGIYEFQPEQWRNNKDGELINIIVSKVQVPLDVKFTLEYAIII